MKDEINLVTDISTYLRPNSMIVPMELKDIDKYVMVKYPILDADSVIDLSNVSIGHSLLRDDAIIISCNIARKLGVNFGLDVVTLVRKDGNEK